MKIFYLQINNNNIITDAIEYEYEGYIPFEANLLPIGINGGWFKFENGKVVENPSLKPIDENTKIQALENESSELVFQNAMQDMRIESVENENADLIFKLAMLEIGGI